MKLIIEHRRIRRFGTLTVWSEQGRLHVNPKASSRLMGKHKVNEFDFTLEYYAHDAYMVEPLLTGETAEIQLHGTQVAMVTNIRKVVFKKWEKK